MKVFHGKQKVKLKRNLARLKREYYKTEKTEILFRIKCLYKLLHLDINDDYFLKE